MKAVRHTSFAPLSSSSSPPPWASSRKEAMSQDIQGCCCCWGKTPSRPGPAHTASPWYTPCSADNGDKTCDLRDEWDWSRSAHGTQLWSHSVTVINYPPSPDSTWTHLERKSSFESITKFYSGFTFTTLFKAGHEDFNVQKKASRWIILVDIHQYWGIYCQLENAVFFLQSLYICSVWIISVHQPLNLYIIIK